MAVVGFRCLSPEEAYRVVDWRSVVFLTCLLPRSGVLVRTGAVEDVFSPLVALAGSPFTAFCYLYAVGVVLNQLVPSVAATVVLAPVALEASTRLAVSPASLAVAVVAATATTFATPLGNAVNLLVMAPAGYTVRDYLRVGLPLAAALYALGISLLPTLWPLRAP